MAITTRREENLISLATVQAHNRTVATLVGANVHADITSQPSGDGSLNQTAQAYQLSAAAPVDLPSAITLCTQLYYPVGFTRPGTPNLGGPFNVGGGLLPMHLFDAASINPVAAGAHKIPDTGAMTTLQSGIPATSTGPVTLADVILWANNSKAALNAHYASVAVHYNTDSAIATANATDLPSALTLLTAIRTSLNAHILKAPATQMVGVLLT
jgi:hypothetical protein